MVVGNGGYDILGSASKYRKSRQMLIENVSNENHPTARGIVRANLSSVICHTGILQYLVECLAVELHTARHDRRCPTSLMSRAAGGIA